MKISVIRRLLYFGLFLAIAIGKSRGQSDPIPPLLSQFSSTDPATREAAFYDLIDLGITPQIGNLPYVIPTATINLITTYPTDAEQIKISLFGLLATENTTVWSSDSSDPTVDEDFGNYYADVVGAVSALRDTRSIPSLIGAIKTGNMAIGTLAAFGVPALDPVIALLSNSDELTRDAATFVLIGMTNPQNFNNIGDAMSQAKLRAALTLVSATASDPYMQVQASQGYSTLPALTTFSAFAVKFESCWTGSFQLNSQITLGSNSNGINPAAEPVIIRAGTFVGLIPAGSFTQRKNGTFTFEGIINSVSLQARILPLGNNTYGFTVEGTSLTLGVGPSPVTLSVIIGDDSGSAFVPVGCS